MAEPTSVSFHSDHFGARRTLDVHAVPDDWRKERHDERKRADERARQKPSESVSSLSMGDEGRDAPEDQSDYP